MLIWAEHESVDDNVNRMTAVAVQVRRFVQMEYLAVDADPDISGFLQVVKEFVVFALALLDNGSQHV